MGFLKISRAGTGTRACCKCTSSPPTLAPLHEPQGSCGYIPPHGGPGLVTVCSRNVFSFLLFLVPSTQPAKQQHRKLFTSTFCWPPAPGGKAKGTQKPVNKSANKLWISFPVCADPCHRLGAGWISPVITQGQFSAHFCCCGSRPAPGEPRSDKNLSSGPSSFIKIYLQSSEYEDTVARSWPG